MKNSKFGNKILDDLFLREQNLYLKNKLTKVKSSLYSITPKLILPKDKRPSKNKTTSNFNKSKNL